MAYLVYHIVVDSAVRRCSRHTAEGEAESIHMVAGEEGAVDSRSRLEAEEDRSFEVAVVGVLHILHGIQLQGNQTYLCKLLRKSRDGEEVAVASSSFSSFSARCCRPNARGRFREMMKMNSVARLNCLMQQVRFRDTLEDADQETLIDRSCSKFLVEGGEDRKVREEVESSDQDGQC